MTSPNWVHRWCKFIIFYLYRNAAKSRIVQAEMYRLFQGRTLSISLVNWFPCIFDHVGDSNNNETEINWWSHVKYGAYYLEKSGIDSLSENHYFGPASDRKDRINRGMAVQSEISEKVIVIIILWCWWQNHYVWMQTIGHQHLKVVTHTTYVT